MKKTLLTISIILFTLFCSNAQTHLLTFETLYQQMISGIAAGTETATYVEAGKPKILLNTDRTSGIFTLVSPSTRTFRLDSCNATFVGHTHNARIRLETNGSSNTTNGRKIYIDCPTPGKLIVGCWTTTASRGYTVEDDKGVVISDANKSMSAVTSTLDLPVHEYNIPSAGRIVLNPNLAIYYGFVEFTQTTGTQTTFLEDKGVSFNGTDIVNEKNLSLEVYNVLGKLIAKSNTTINTNNFEKGIYMVRAQGVQDAFKFSK